MLIALYKELPIYATFTTAFQALVSLLLGEVGAVALHIHDLPINLPEILEI